jgi:uncharacterized peroxidase-related enzyme
VVLECKSNSLFGAIMSRLSIPTVEQSLPSAQSLLAPVQQQFGMVPNMMRLVGRSPAALEGYLSLSSALGKSSLPLSLRERIALTISEYNGCDYCVSAHDYVSRQIAKLSDTEIAAAREAHSLDIKIDAALRFSLQVAKTRGRVSDDDLRAVRLAGFDEAQVIEIVSAVALNVLANYINNVAQTDIDFPKVMAKTA